MILRQFLHQVKFNLNRIFFFCESQPSGYPLYMCVHHHAGFMENISPDHIGGLPSHARQRSQRLQIVWNLCSVLLHQFSCAGNDIFRLIVIKSGGSDILFQLFQIRRSEFLQRIIFTKKIRCHLVYPGIRTLGAEQRSDQKLPRRLIMQGEDGFCPLFPIQEPQDLSGSLGHLSTSVYASFVRGLRLS